VHLDYTTVLNTAFLALAAVLVVRYFRRFGGVSMLRAMNRPTADRESARGRSSKRVPSTDVALVEQVIIPGVWIREPCS
jgi:hypothetical protein